MRVSSREQVTRAIEHMESRIADPITLPEVCQHLGVSPRTLQMTFRKELGCTPMAWLRKRRLQAAKEHLVRAESGATTVTRVALDLGITHLGRFAVEYHRLFGITPSATLAKPIPQT